MLAAKCEDLSSANQDPTHVVEREAFPQLLTAIYTLRCTHNIFKENICARLKGQFGTHVASYLQVILSSSLLRCPKY